MGKKSILVVYTEQKDDPTKPTLHSRCSTSLKIKLELTSKLVSIEWTKRDQGSLMP